MNIEIDPNSSTPVYQQVIQNIEESIATGKLAPGDILPSMNTLSEELKISKETAKKAYGILRTKGYLESAQGKGFFVRSANPTGKKKILMLFDKLSTYKLVLYRSFVENVGNEVDITIHLHNQDPALFESMLDSYLGNYDYYIITPHFPLEAETEDIIRRSLQRIPNRQLIILDKFVNGITGNIGMVYQDFKEDVYEGLKKSIDYIHKYKKTYIFATSISLYAPQLKLGIRRFFEENKLPFEIHDHFDAKYVKKGGLYLMLGGQLDTEHFDILRTAKQKNLVFGEDAGLICYNDSPINEFIADGLATLSTDFAEMGRLAAEMVKSGQLFKIHNRFDLIPRKTV